MVFQSMAEGRWSMFNVFIAGHLCLCLLLCISGVDAETVESASNPWWMKLLHPLVFLPFHLGNVLCISRVFPNWAFGPLILLGLSQYIFEHQYIFVLAALAGFIAQSIIVVGVFESLPPDTIEGAIKAQNDPDYIGIHFLGHAALIPWLVLSAWGIESKKDENEYQKEEDAANAFTPAFQNNYDPAAHKNKAM